MNDEDTGLPREFVQFDSLPDAAFVPLEVLSHLFAISDATVWRWVKLGILPKPYRFARSTRWNVGELRRAEASFTSGPMRPRFLKTRLSS